MAVWQWDARGGHSEGHLACSCSLVRERRVLLEYGNLSVARRWPSKCEPSLQLAAETELIGGMKATHVLLIADPQVLDMRSYPDRSWLLAKLTQFVVDLNMRKSWSATRGFRPDVVVFLGDMMDNGRFASDDDEYVYYPIIHVVPPVFLALTGRLVRSFL